MATAPVFGEPGNPANQAIALLKAQSQHPDTKMRDLTITSTPCSNETGRCQVRGAPGGPGFRDEKGGSGSELRVMSVQQDRAEGRAQSHHDLVAGHGGKWSLS